MTNAERAAEIIRLYALDAATNSARFISYGELTRLLGLPTSAARTLGPALDLVEEECERRGLPNIAAVIVNSDTLKSERPMPSPGAGILKRHAADIDRLQQDVRSFNWKVVETGN